MKRGFSGSSHTRRTLEPHGGLRMPLPMSPMDACRLGVAAPCRRTERVSAAILKDPRPATECSRRHTESTPWSYVAAVSNTPSVLPSGAMFLLLRPYGVNPGRRPDGHSTYIQQELAPICLQDIEYCYFKSTPGWGSIGLLGCVHIG